MPYKCEECQQLGARLNHIFEKRLCVNCLSSNKYKLICKSEVLKRYQLTKTDLTNYQYEEILCTNPIYPNASPMTLYYEREIKTFFINKYKKIIEEKLNFQEYISEDNIDYIITLVLNYLVKQKQESRENKFNKILKKFDLKLEELPEEIIELLSSVSTATEYEKVIVSYIKRNELYEELKKYNLEKYIDYQVCLDYCLNTSNYSIQQVISIIQNILQKKQMVKEALKKNNLSKNKYVYQIESFINSTELFNVDNFIETLLNEENNY